MGAMERIRDLLRVRIFRRERIAACEYIWGSATRRMSIWGIALAGRRVSGGRRNGGGAFKDHGRGETDYRGMASLWVLHMGYFVEQYPRFAPYIQ